MKILIVETVWMGGVRYRFLDKTLLTAFSLLPTLQARELAASTPKHHTVSVVNERYTPIPFEGDYDLVSINFVTSTAPRAYAIADAFRKKGIPVVVSGFHASALPDEAKQHADSVMIGKPELTWPQVVADAEKKQLQPVYHPTSTFDSIPIHPTTVTLPGFVITGAVEATRGCPYHCEFCPEASITGSSQYYERPVDEVITEIKALPQKTLIFYDASLTIHPAYTKTLFKKMKGLHKKFFCNGNVDVLARGPELVSLSEEAGCVAWLIGFESVSQTSLDAVGKTTNKVSEYSQAIQNIHDHGMIVIGCFMFGFDTDTTDVFAQTLQAIRTWGIDIADFSILTPLPGTPIYQQFEQEGRLLTKDWKYYNMGHVVFKPKQMTPDELLQGVRMMYDEFYAPPYTIKRIMGSLRHGVYPFAVSFARNMVAMMSRRRVGSLKKS